MKDKELMLEAIDHYEIYQPQGRAILKSLVAVADNNNTAIISVKDLSNISKVSRQGVYNTLIYLTKDNILQRNSKTRRLSEFSLNTEKLEKILDYYQSLVKAKKLLKKI
jgi:CTP-dependent riboflavin kinase